ncbi:MAG TPA: hypothetical protein VMB81_07720 [Candidatus Sulfotelmatobacter sp.]|nr:hypothetical protein [Candidatus Sulfotelmatobacter sp.]
MRPVIAGFVAGAIGVAIGHQFGWLVLHELGLAPFGFYQMKAIPPWGVPQIVSQCFWGGIWGIVLAYALPYRGRINYWVFAALFGLVAPSLVGWLVVPLIKGTPLMGGPPWLLQAVRPLPNAAFTVVAAMILLIPPLRSHA